ncbi:MAG TPA: glycoside hydrolase family 15 protein [Gaiellaceae bacterium]
MPRIEDYGMVSDLQTAALISSEGSVDWLCFPHFDSGACFAALLGTPEHGRWRVAPRGDHWRCDRRYRKHTLVLETDWQTDTGSVRVIDFMPPRGEAPDIVRIVVGLSGEVEMNSELVIRFDYGSIIPWVRRIDDARIAVAGPDGLCFRTPVESRGENMRTIADFTVCEGDRVPFVLTWYPSNDFPPDAIDPEVALDETEQFWREWAAQCTYRGEWRDAVLESLTVLKGLTFAPTGGIVAAPTTSLPEQIGGVRNWDYRHCWLRDATLTLLAFLNAGYLEEAAAWRVWLLRAAAGDPADLQIMYGLAGQRRLPELELSWLPGYEGSRPVRIGNAATEQLQLDVYGEVLDALHQGRVHELGLSKEAWALQRRLLTYLENIWKEPDEGIWEVRGPRRHFTHSKVMAWVAFDRGVQAVERFGRNGPVDRWRNARAEIHDEVCRRGFDTELNSFTGFYGSKRVDASLLMIPLVGFLPAQDPRMIGTVAQIERQLMLDGFVQRYRQDEQTQAIDGLPPGEGAFLPCTFWLADNLALQGRLDEARALFERLLALRNELGLLAEEYDPAQRRQLGNYPQAFTHVALVNTAFNLSQAMHPSPIEQRRPEEQPA